MLSLGKSLWHIMRHRQDGRELHEQNVTGKIVIVTGSNTGIGKETALEMAKRGSIVIMACRDLNKAGEARKEILSKVPAAQLDILKLDLGDLASVREFSEIFKNKYSRLDILINNAGVLIPGYNKTKDGLEINMGVNHLAHFLLTLLLLEHLRKGVPSRVICVSSSGALTAKLKVDDLNMDKERFGGFWGMGPYANSKLANIIFTQELARRLSESEEPSDKEITCYALCPGIVISSLPQYYGFFSRNLWKVLFKTTGVDGNQGCQTTLYCALSTEAGMESGKMYRCAQSWDAFERKDDMKEDGRKLWENSEKLVGLERGFS